MKRIVFLAAAAALFASCERTTAPESARFDTAAPAPTSTGTATTFSGDATVLRADLLDLPEIVVGEAGPVSASGGAAEFTLLSVSPDQTGGLLAGEAVHATVIAQGNSSSAEASVASATLTVAGHTIQADLLRAQANATCNNGQASVSGSAEVVGLVIDRTAITVTGEANQPVSVAGVTAVINQQSGSASGNQGGITVNALHVTVVDPLSGETLADVIIASAHADITCGSCTPPLGDFVTGGGWITGTPTASRANFAVAGGIKQGGLWGHLTYIDHGASDLHVKGTGVTGYEVMGPTTRRITGTADINGTSGTYTVYVTDAGEPGRDDLFTITLSNGYSASGKLVGGNIQLHPKPAPCP